MKFQIILFLFIFFFIPFTFSQTTDKNIDVIKKYYSLFIPPMDSPFVYPPESQLKEAYKISPKQIDYATFYKWYHDTTNNFVFDIISAGENKFFLKVLMYWQQKPTLFDVTMTIQNKKIVKSSSKLLHTFKKSFYSYGTKIFLSADNKSKTTIITLDNIRTNKTKILYKSDKFLPNIQIITIGQFILYGFPNSGYSIYDIESSKDHKLKYSNFYISPNKQFIFSYKSSSSDSGGLMLEIKDNKLVHKSIEKNINVDFINIIDENNKKYLMYKKGGESIIGYEGIIAEYKNMQQVKIELDKL